MMDMSLTEYKTLDAPPTNDGLRFLIHMAYEEGALTAVEAQALSDKIDRDSPVTPVTPVEM